MSCEGALFEKSSYVGVSWRAARSKWQVYRTANGKVQHGGDFADELEAARRSDEFAKEIGSNGRLNFPNAESVRKKEVKNPRKRKKSPPQNPRKRQRRSGQKKVTLSMSEFKLTKVEFELFPLPVGITQVPLRPNKWPIKFDFCSVNAAKENFGYQ